MPIVSDRNILNGLPVFEGTRVPVAFVLESVARGYSLAELKEAYPFITQQLIEQAKVFAAKHPGMVDCPSGDHEAWKTGLVPISSSRILPPGKS